jgi:molybdopterin converting factor small subunit
MLMSVTVKLPTLLRSQAEGAAVVEASGSTVGVVLDDLDGRYPGISARIRRDGGLSRFVNVYVNEDDVRRSGALDAPVGEGDTLTIIPAVAGGSIPGVLRFHPLRVFASRDR